MHHEIIGADSRHFKDLGWLRTYWLFSFGDYYDPENAGHGKLRVFNDDWVAPNAGFPTHPHQEMEIVTIVLGGEITHEDSMGNRGVIKAGEVQRMSAGTGLTHSEYNLADEPLLFYQVWIHPGQRGLSPSYEQRRFQPGDYENRLLPIASGRGHSGAVSINADAAIYRARMDGRVDLAHPAATDRKVFVYVTSGALFLDGLPLGAKDQARIGSAESVTFTAEGDTDFIVIDVPE
jgi:redox-sensitive bicupin YhaK (pirin superfamily)